jgi:hypothetical protein
MLLDEDENSDTLTHQSGEDIWQEDVLLEDLQWDEFGSGINSRSEPETF